MALNLPGTTREEELKRTARVLEIVQLIVRAPRRYSRKALAAHFELQERTITKDLQIIRHGLKLDLQSSPDGYYFTQMPSLPVLRYSFAEALALLNAVQAAQKLAMVGNADLAAAVARLRSLFPPEFAPLLQQVSQATVVSEHGQQRQRMMTLLNRALLGHNKLAITYETASRGGEVTERVVHPYALMPHERSWQMVAYCELRSDVRMFKVDRIQQATILDVAYRIPEDFSLAQYIGDAWGAMRGEGEAEEVELHFTAQAGRWIAEEEWHSSQRIDHLDDGSVLFWVTVPITSEFVRWIMHYGGEVRVVKPAALRLRVCGEHMRAVEACR